MFVLLPKHEADQIKDTLASYAAAEDTLRRATPQTDEGKAAQRAMKTRLATEDERLTTLFRRSWPAPASSRVAVPNSLPQRCAAASRRPPTGRSSASSRSSRRQRQLGQGRHQGPRRRARRPRCSRPPRRADHQRRMQGGPRRRQPRRHQGRRSPQTLRRTAVRLAEGRRQRCHPYLAAGNIRATQDGKDLAGPKELPPTQIGKVTLYKEDEPPPSASASP